MIQLGLSMILKDEENQIAECLKDIIDVFDDVIITDTGSTDKTVEILQDQFGITPLRTKLDKNQCFSKAGVRTTGYGKLSTKWVLSLDADERINRKELEKIKSMRETPGVSGYFCSWKTFNGRASPIEDYKLCLFKKGFKSLGDIHENVQINIREQGQFATWLDDLTIVHYPEASKIDLKKKRYKQSLLCAINSNPTWFRYHWFLGYRFFRDNKFKEAIMFLSHSAFSRSLKFPVECLNSCIVLAQIYASLQHTKELQNVIENALSFYAEVAHDFEVKINFRLKPWLDNTCDLMYKGELDKIIAYKFAD